MNRRRVIELTKYAFECAVDSACSGSEEQELKEACKLAVGRLRPSRRRSTPKGRIERGRARLVIAG
jgi:hypothetical protein